MTSTLPELVLVHGAWHGAWAWSWLLPVLRERGWTAHVVDNPSAGSKLGLNADADHRRAVPHERSVPIVLVDHSYGGTIITRGGVDVDHVVGLVYLCAARPDVGDVVLKDPHSPDEVPYWICVDHDDEAIYAEHSEEILYNDCPPDVVADVQARLTSQSLTSFLEPMRPAAWRERVAEGAGRTSVSRPAARRSSRVRAMSRRSCTGRWPTSERDGEIIACPPDGLT